MIDARKATEEISKLGMLPFFPTEQGTRLAIVSLVCGLASDTRQVEWLVRRCLALWSRWEGPHELRAVFCSKYRPADGIEAHSHMEQFADGIPSESESIAGNGYRELTAREMLQIEGTTKSPEFVRDATDLLHEKIERMKAVETAPIPTAEEIERIKAEQARRRRYA